MFLVFWHMTLATVLTQILSRTTSMLPGVKDVSKLRYRLSTIRSILMFIYPFTANLQGKVTTDVIINQIVPVAGLFAFSLVFNNKAYIYLSVSYIQVYHILLSLTLLRPVHGLPFNAFDVIH